MRVGPLFFYILYALLSVVAVENVSPPDDCTSFSISTLGASMLLGNNLILYHLCFGLSELSPIQIWSSRIVNNSGTIQISKQNLSVTKFLHVATLVKFFIKQPCRPSGPLLFQLGVFFQLLFKTRNRQFYFDVTLLFNALSSQLFHHVLHPVAIFHYKKYLFRIRLNIISSFNSLYCLKFVEKMLQENLQRVIAPIQRCSMLGKKDKFFLFYLSAS